MIEGTQFYRAAGVLLAFVVVSSGCKSDSNDGDASSAGTTTTAASAALTKAVTFSGGSLVDGLMPPSTASDVSLLSLSKESGSPGDTVLLGFDLDNPDSTNGVDRALVQFEGSDDHFEVDPTAGSAAADGGKGGDHFELSFEIDSGVCERLCDTVYPIRVTQAVKLADGGVSKHAETTFTLDCTETGDHTQCGSGRSTGQAGERGGDVAGASSEAGSGGGATSVDAGTSGRDSGSSVAPRGPCPIGTWTSSITGAGTCDGTTGTVTITIEDRGGQLVATQEQVNVMAGPDMCGLLWTDIAVTYEGSTVSFDVASSESCAAKHFLYSATVDAECATMTTDGSFTSTNCESCDAANGGNCFGCGTVSCTVQYGAGSWTRK